MARSPNRRIISIKSFSRPVLVGTNCRGKYILRVHLQQKDIRLKKRKMITSQIQHLTCTTQHLQQLKLLEQEIMHRRQYHPPRFHRFLHLFQDVKPTPKCRMLTKRRCPRYNDIDDTFPVEYFFAIIYIYVNTFIKISLFYFKKSTATAEKSDIRKQYPIRQKFSTISTFSQFRKSRGREPREPNNYLSLVHEREKSKFSLAGQDQKQNGELIHSNVTPFTTSILFETSHKIIILLLFSSVL